MRQAHASSRWRGTEGVRKRGITEFREKGWVLGQLKHVCVFRIQSDEMSVLRRESALRTERCPELGLSQWESGRFHRWPSLQPLYTANAEKNINERPAMNSRYSLRSPEKSFTLRFPTLSSKDLKVGEFLWNKTLQLNVCKCAQNITWQKINKYHLTQHLANIWMI